MDATTSSLIADQACQIFELKEKLKFLHQKISSLESADKKSADKESADKKSADKESAVEDSTKISSSSDAQAPSPGNETGNIFSRLTPTSEFWVDDDNLFAPFEVSAPVEDSASVEDSAPVEVSASVEDTAPVKAASSDEGFQVVQSKKVVKEVDLVKLSILLWDEDKHAARSIINDMTEMPHVDHLSDEEWQTFRSIVFWRTTGCSNYYGAGKHCSYGANCLFAHGNRRNIIPTWWEEDGQLWSYKTKFCKFGVKCFNSGCTYAHSDDELRCREC